MKAVIVELREKTVAALSDDGCIVKIKNENYEIGQKVDLNKKFRCNFKKVNFKRAVVIAAAGCLLSIFGTSAIAYYTPSAYVSLDGTLSIEYSLNVFDRVLSVKGVNGDGSNIIDEISLDNLGNKTIDEAIVLTVETIAKAGYLDGEKSEIEITAAAKDLKKAGALAQNLEKVADETCEQNHCRAEVNAEAVGAECVAKAKELGVTPGKLNLVEKLVKSAEDPESINLAEWLNKSVKEIQAKTKENKELTKDKEKNDGEKSEQNDKTGEDSETKGNTLETLGLNKDNSDKKQDNGQNNHENQIKDSEEDGDTESVSGDGSEESEPQTEDTGINGKDDGNGKPEDSNKENSNKS